MYFASAAVALDSSHMTASSFVSWSRFSPPSKFVNGHVSTTFVMVWPQSQESDWARPHLCKLAWHEPWSVGKRFITYHVWRGRSKPGCRIVGWVTIVWLTTEADDQSSLLCVIVSTVVMSDHGLGVKTVKTASTRTCWDSIASWCNWLKLSAVPRHVRTSTTRHRNHLVCYWELGLKVLGTTANPITNASTCLTLSLYQSP